MATGYELFLMFIDDVGTEFNTHIMRLAGAKNSIKAAIEDKGVIVDSEATLDDYADLIRQIGSSE